MDLHPFHTHMGTHLLPALQVLRVALQHPVDLGRQLVHQPGRELRLR